MVTDRLTSAKCVIRTRLIGVRSPNPESMLPPGLFETRRVVSAMRELGATSPATARPFELLPDDVRTQLERLVQSGLVREGAPGTYYLFQPESLPWTAGRILKAALFWFLVVIIPVVILQLSNSRPAP